MTMRTRLPGSRAALPFALALALGISPALAQQTQASPPAAATPAPAAAPKATAAAPKAAPGAPSSARVEEQITRLHRELAITPAEQPQWDAFVQVMRSNAQRLDALYAQRAQSAPSLNAVADMQSYAEIEQAHAESVQALVAPFQALYSAMSPAQQKTADAVFRNAAEHAGRRAARRG
jgi:hypothetical protein